MKEHLSILVYCFNTYYSCKEYFFDKYSVQCAIGWTIHTAVAGAALKGCVRISESRGVKSATFPPEDDLPEDDPSAPRWPVTHQWQSASQTLKLLFYLYVSSQICYSWVRKLCWNFFKCMRNFQTRFIAIGIYLLLCTSELLLSNTETCASHPSTLQHVVSVCVLVWL